MGVIQLKKRTAGAAGAPAALKSAEPAYNMVDRVLYVGFGDDGNGNATSVLPLGGEGAVCMLTGAQTINGVKTFAAAPKAGVAAAAADDLTRKGEVEAALAAKAPLASPALTGVPTAPTAAAGTNTMQLATTAFVQTEVAGAMAGAGLGDVVGPAASADGEIALFSGATGKILKRGAAIPSAQVAGLDAALAGKAPLASPALTGVPTAPTAVAGTSTTQLATTAFVAAALAALVNGSAATLDTLNELAAAIGNDANFAATITALVGQKLAKANNLSDLPDAAAARGNLGLGSMATQAADAVAIDGGTIGAAVFLACGIDGGTF